MAAAAKKHIENLAKTKKCGSMLCISVQNSLADVTKQSLSSLGMIPNSFLNL